MGEEDSWPSPYFFVSMVAVLPVELPVRHVILAP